MSLEKRRNEKRLYNLYSCVTYRLFFCTFCVYWLNEKKSIYLKKIKNVHIFTPSGITKFISSSKTFLLPGFQSQHRFLFHLFARCFSLRFDSLIVSQWVFFSSLSHLFITFNQNVYFFGIRIISVRLCTNIGDILVESSYIETFIIKRKFIQSILIWFLSLPLS